MIAEICIGAMTGIAVFTALREVNKQRKGDLEELRAQIRMWRPRAEATERRCMLLEHDVWHLKQKKKRSGK